MHRTGLRIMLLMLLAGPAMAAADDTLHPPIPYEVIAERVEANRAALGLDNGAAEPERTDFERLLFPVRARANATPFRVHLVTNYVDHDAYGPGFLRDYECGVRTYDLPGGYDHAGTDFVASTFQEVSTEAGWMEVIAAAGGVVLDRHDGEPDRNARGRNESVISNYIVIRQDDGMEVFYYHLARDSVVPLEIGERVQAGDYLGLAASSGTSSEPHLHFQMHHPARFQRIVDPYGGPCASGPEPVWQHQHDYTDPVITGIFTHDAAPVRPSQYGQPEAAHFRQSFAPGEAVFASVFVRDQAQDVAAETDMLDPAGNVVASDSFLGPVFPLAFVNHSVFSYTLPLDAPSGTWRIRTRYAGDIRERAFYVSHAPDAGVRLASATLPASRSVQTGELASVFATVVNNSDVSAEGCWIGPGAPFDGQFRYRMTDPATNAASGPENAIFDIPPRGSRSFVLSFRPEADSEARGYELPVRFKCDNGDAAPYLGGINSALLSFGASATPDLVAIAITPSADGVLRLADADTNGAFAVAVANVGAAGALNVRPQGTGEAAGLDLVLCETDPAAGTCLAPASLAVSRIFAAGETASFAVFARPGGAVVSFAPARSRIRLVAEDAGGVIRGSTSVAVRTH